MYIPAHFSNIIRNKQGAKAVDGIFNINEDIQNSKTNLEQSL